MSEATEKKSGSKMLIVVILIAAVIGVIAIKNRNGQEATGDRISDAGTAADSPADGSNSSSAVSDKIPTLIDLGSKSCIPCKMMEPILTKLKTEYAGRMKVVFIDVWENRQAGAEYGIRMIPTQLFFDADGKELFRHEGFMSREDILGKWRALGVDIEKKKGAAPTEDTISSAPSLPDNGGGRDEAAEKQENQEQEEQNGPRVAAEYPSLTSGALSKAKLADLPEGMLLKADGVEIKAASIDEQLKQAPAEMRKQLEKNRFFLLENMATEQLLLLTAKKAGKFAEGDTRSAIQEYLQDVASRVEVSDEEAKAFYDENKSMMGGMPFAQAGLQIKQYLAQQKQQELVQEHIRTLGDRMNIQVNLVWTAAQAKLAMDNPVDKARASGKPTMVEFGAEGCGPCDMMQPILENLERKYAGKANIVFVKVNDEQLLASRFGIRGIPVQAFYDKDGKEIFRHTGFFPQEECEKWLKKAGGE